MRGSGLVTGIVLWLTAVTAAAAEPACAVQSFEDSAFTVCRFNSRHDELRLVWKFKDPRTPRTFDGLRIQLGPTARRLRFAMNAGMFEEGGMPLGLYVEGGQPLRPLNTRSGGGNFYLKPNGVFSMAADGTLRLDTADAFAARGSQPLLATQSGPMLLVAGKLNPQIAEDGPSQNIRNGVGLRDAHTALFVISDDPVSFGRLARFFRDQLGCRDALYLDGTVSSLWAPSLDRDDNQAALGPMFVVLDRR